MLNEIPVLDKGHVAMHSCSPTGQELFLLSKEFFRGQKDAKLFDVAQLHIKVKCPLFVQMTFPEFGLRYIIQRGTGKPEAFVPTVNQVNAMSLEASEAIQEDIQRTTEALLLNPKSYQTEHCDLFVSQVISPISVYNTLMVYGSLEQWNNYVSQVGLPAPIEAYRKAIDNIVMAEYSQLSKG
jgi:glutaredoxin 2